MRGLLSVIGAKCVPVPWRRSAMPEIDSCRFRDAPFVEAGHGRPDHALPSRFRSGAPRAEYWMNTDSRSPGDDVDGVAAALPEHVPTRPLWAELRDAIRGTGADYTKIPPPRAAFLLAVAWKTD